VASWLLREASLERIQLRTETGNERILAAARAAGFQDEGVLHGYVRERGERVDNAVLSLVHRDLAG
jgi:RimJ/RimL family protein N-acetyltransferase